MLGFAERERRGLWTSATAAPIYAGQPGYSYSLDRDRDGVACE
ncbi:MAG: excalibur calcium-binding domain-containing protein [Arthrobacter sp.]